MQQKENKMVEEGDETQKYDANKREPIYAGAENTLVWELTVFANHFHPTIRKYATHLIKGE
jgi:ribosome biogenesis protein MAK21